MRSRNILPVFFTTGMLIMTLLAGTSPALAEERVGPDPDQGVPDYAIPFERNEERTTFVGGTFDFLITERWILASKLRKQSAHIPADCPHG